MDRDSETYAIIGAAMEVHRVLGHGFLEAVYQEALAHELTLRGIPFLREVDLAIIYKDVRLNTTYRADFVCYDSIIVELKALEKVASRDHAQVINYLMSTHSKRALLLNFGGPSLEHERFVLNY